MVVPPAARGTTTSGTAGPMTTTTTTTTTTNTAASTPPPGVRASPAESSQSSGQDKQKSTLSLTGNGYSQYNAVSMPFSARRASPLDLSSVERKGQLLPSRESQHRTRPHGLKEAPTYRPSEDEFKDPMQYIQSIAPEGRKYGIVKIIPPSTWSPPFAIDTERFHFRTRRQELNSVEGGTRANLNYLDQLHKFHKQHGNNLNRFPSVDKRPLDLYKLKKAVEARGGFDKVCKLKKWAEIGRDLGYSGKIMSSLSTSLKNSYQRWLGPYEEYLAGAKPGVQQQLEFEYGGPLTPSPNNSPMKKSSHQNTPNGSMRDDSPAVKASNQLNATLKESDESDTKTPPATAPKPNGTSGFTAVNSGGFTAVNASPSGFTAVNGPVIKRDPEASNTPLPKASHSPGDPMKLDPTPDRSISNGFMPNGTSSNHLKRQRSGDSSERDNKGKELNLNGDSPNSLGRRNKRIKKEIPPTVAGSHMTFFRPSGMKNAGDKASEPPVECEACGNTEDQSSFLVCDGCDSSYHRDCLDARDKAQIVSEPDWHCPRCLVGTGEFGFEEGSVYSLKQFQEKAHTFKESYFMPKMPFDPILNCKRPVTEDDVEREFWKLVESLTDTVEVEYGADIHSTTHGSGFPTLEKNPLDPYATDPWNLNIMPLHSESLFRHIKSDISGMTVPWLYVGMCFSTFCWHNEDHYSYSANYQHFGATKTWYGIPGEDAEKFENAMRSAVPELFETQPDLLFQLVTLLPPDQLRKAGVRVYAVDQRAGQFVITFPQAYHAGFNHGFNFNEAVNFAPHDWEPWGESGVERLQSFRRQPCFSHDELLMTAASRDVTIKTAKWLAPALERSRKREFDLRRAFTEQHRVAYGDHACSAVVRNVDQSFRCALDFEIDDRDVPEEEYQCAFCKCFCYLSRFYCKESEKVVCLMHAGNFSCCESPEQERFAGASHVLRYRMTDDALDSIVQKVVDRARTPEAWTEKLEALLTDDPKPALKQLRSLLAEGEKIPYELPQLPSLKAFVERCNDWVEEATNYIIRKQQNRRKNEKAWRKNNNARAAETEEKERELRKPENVTKLLAEAEEISFDCPEIGQLKERAEAIGEFQQHAQSALGNPDVNSTPEIHDLLEMGRGFNIDFDEVEILEKIVQQKEWHDDVKKAIDTAILSYDDLIKLLDRAHSLRINPDSADMQYLFTQKAAANSWEEQAQETLAADTTSFPQLDALVHQASYLPVSPETLLQVERLLSKQREAHQQIVSMYERSRNADLRKRPPYREIRDVMDAIAELPSKPTGTVDLEKEQKRHEDWMRKGKKLFGKANAPLHILLMHMNHVRDRNASCLKQSQPTRPPVEPISRGTSPDPRLSPTVIDGPSRGRDVFCICRQTESGMMIECEVCHEWYHGKCLKIARGKVKEDEKFTCPICDWRVKIPRDAARPKLEDLVEWQAEIQILPFQPDEEECLAHIIETAQRFRDFIRPRINNMMTTLEQLPTLRYYLRKIEGAEVLLVNELNYFRRELHRWAPIAPDPPPAFDHSYSTRKPRPTKQQKLMAQYGIANPAELPQSLRTKQHSFSNKSIDSQSSRSGAPPSLQDGRSNTATPPATSEQGSAPSMTGPPNSAGPYYVSYETAQARRSSAARTSPALSTDQYGNDDSALASPAFMPQSRRPSGPSMDDGEALFDAAPSAGLDKREPPLSLSSIPSPIPAAQAPAPASAPPPPFENLTMPDAPPPFPYVEDRKPSSDIPINPLSTVFGGFHHKDAADPDSLATSHASEALALTGDTAEVAPVQNGDGEMQTTEQEGFID